MIRLLQGAPSGGYAGGMGANALISGSQADALGALYAFDAIG